MAIFRFAVVADVATVLPRKFSFCSNVFLKVLEKNNKTFTFFSLPDPFRIQTLIEYYYFHGNIILYIASIRI